MGEAPRKTGQMPNSFEEQTLMALRSIHRNQCRIISMMEARQTARLPAFLKKTWSAFYARLATNLGQWLAGLPLWLLALEGLGLHQLLAKWFGFSM